MLFDTQKNKVLEAMSDPYFGIYVIDLKKDTFTEIKSQDLFRQMLQSVKSAQEGLNILCNRMVASEHQEDTESFLNLATLPRRLEGKQVVSFEYYGTASGWSRANFYPMEWDGKGELSKVVFSAEKQHDLKARQMHAKKVLEQELTEKDSAYELLKKKALESTIYLDALQRNATFLYYFDLTEGYLTSDIEMPGGVSGLQMLGLSVPVSYDEFRKAYYEKMQIHTLENADDQVYREDLLLAFARGQTAVSTEYYSERFDKYHRNMIYMTRRESDDHIIAVVIGSDTTQQREAEEATKRELRNAYAEAQRANKAKTDFLSRMSHDVRTPINGIVGMAHIMESQPENHEIIQEGVRNIKMLSRQLELLINDVLEMSRIENGKIKLANEAFDLPQKLSENTPAIHSMAEERGVLLAGSYMDIQHRQVVSSPIHIQRIFMNILSNAVKYNRVGGTIECWLKEEVKDDAHSNYTFTVKDTGIGMSESYLAKIFEPFSREQNSVDTGVEGTGLGMAITKELVEMMGGTIQVESRLGVGTSVTVMLPLAFTGEIQKEDDGCKVISLKGRKILLVEDNRMNIEIARYVLQEEQADVDVARNGQEAIEVFARSCVGYYDLILMDIMMPVMNGYDAAKAIRSLERADAATVPIVAMTANAFDEDVKKSIEAGMNDHIAKPIDIPLMMAKIAKYL